MKNMSHKTNKKRVKFSKRNRRNKRSRRNKQSRRNIRQRGGNYNAEQIQQITDTIKANNNLIDITDEEITQFINKINPNAAVFASVHHRHSRFPRLLDLIMDIETREELQEFGDEIKDFIEAADNTDFESEDSDI
jgi:hypothetical protein